MRHTVRARKIWKLKFVQNVATAGKAGTKKILWERNHVQNVVVQLGCPAFMLNMLKMSCPFKSLLEGKLKIQTRRKCGR